MPDILKLISQADRLDFSQNYGIARPNFLGDCSPISRPSLCRLSICGWLPALLCP